MMNDVYKPIVSKAARQIWMLGALRISGSQGPLRLIGGKMRSLLAFLVLHPQVPHTRDVLAELLWPEAPPARSRHNIANLIYSLRQTLGAGWVVVEGDRVSLQNGPDLWVDVWEFERRCLSDQITDLEQAVELYTAELLPDIYDEWVLPRRTLLSEQYLDALMRLAQTAEQYQRPQEAYSYYYRLTCADPLSEQGYRGLMRTLARLGRLNDALTTYDRLAQTLQTELDEQPTAETRLFADLLRSELELLRRPLDGPGPSSPFVGRRMERSQLLARLETARNGKGGIVVLLGEAGVGKTRLLEELSRAAEWRGWQVAWGHGQEFALPAPHMPLSHALAAALPLPRLQQLAARVQPIWLTMIAGLVPQIAAFQNRSGWSALSQSQDYLPTAIAHVLRGLCQIAPHILILDDIQWSDPELWPLLDRLRPQLSELSIVLLVSGRIEDLRAQVSVWSMIQMWDASGDMVLRLAGLSSSELEELAVAHGVAPLSGDQLAVLVSASAGNPLLALALLQSSWTTGQTDGFPPIEQTSLNSLLQRRLDTLSQQALLVLELGAVLGYRFHYRLWERMVGIELMPNQLPMLAVELEQAGLLVLETDGYRFAHDTLRAFVYQKLPASRRQLLHRRALDLLDPTDDSAILVLLHHAEQADDQQMIVRYALMAGEQAFAGFSFRTALRFFSQALEHVPEQALDARYRALYGRLRALDVLADREAQRRDLSQLQALADLVGDARRQVEVAQLHSEFFWGVGAWEQAQDYAERTLALANEVHDVRRQARALELLSRVAQNRGQYHRAQELLEQAQVLYRSLNDPFGEATTTHNRGIVVWALGDYQAAIKLFEGAVQLLHELGASFQETRALNSLGCAFWGVGHYHQSRAMHERALALSRDLSDKWGESANILNLGHVALAVGDYITAIDHFSTALDGFRAINNTSSIAVCLSNLSTVYRLLGDLQATFDYAAEALQLSRATGYRRVEAYAEYNRGLALLASGRVEEACVALECAFVMRSELGEIDNILESHAGLALALQEAGLVQRATELINAALDLLSMRHERPVLRQWVYYVAYRVHGVGDRSNGLEHLHRAEAAMLEVAGALSTEERNRFLQNVPLNRETQAALSALRQQIRVRLVRNDVPLGRKLAEDDYREVTWTVYSPGDERYTRPDQRRQHVLRRLLDEATAQGGAPTDDDLAVVLGVSRRTVLRDMKLLSRSGISAPTRRRGRE